MTGIKLTFALILSLGLTPMPLAAQDKPAPPDAESFGLIERGMRQLFEGLLSDMEPALDEMGKALKELEPMARELVLLLGDVRNYAPPERLPNGDILIRRKPGVPLPETPPHDQPSPQIDL